MRVKLDEKAFVPCRAHGTDSGLDLKTPHYFVLFAHSKTLVDTGVHVRIPAEKSGFMLDATVEGRSSLNKRGVVVEGLVDNEYTGSIRVNMINTSDEDIEFERGDRIAQLVIRPVVIEDVEIVSELEQTERGDKGFGSTGR